MEYTFITCLLGSLVIHDPVTKTTYVRPCLEPVQTVFQEVVPVVSKKERGLPLALTVPPELQTVEREVTRGVTFHKKVKAGKRKKAKPSKRKKPKSKKHRRKRR
jgi:hypothetical protein